MSTALRLPISWNDRGLLEDPPFSDVFVQRKFSQFSQPQRGRRSDDWIERLAEQIRDAPPLRAAAARWAEFAFNPYEKIQPSRKTPKPPQDSSLETIKVFVRFYWAWYSDGDESAYKVVNNERKRRGFGWRLPSIQNNGPDEELANSGSTTTRSSARGRGRPPKRGNVARRDSAAAVDLAQPVIESFTVFVDQDHNVMSQFAKLDDVEEGKDNMLIFSAEHDVDAFLASQLHAGPVQPSGDEGPMISDGSRSPTAMSGNPPPLDSRSSTAVSANSQERSLEVPRIPPTSTMDQGHCTEPRIHISSGNLLSSPSVKADVHHHNVKRARSDMTMCSTYESVSSDPGRQSPRKRSKIRPLSPTWSSAPAVQTPSSPLSSAPPSSPLSSLPILPVRPIVKSTRARSGATVPGKTKKKKTRRTLGKPRSKMPGSRVAVSGESALPPAAKRQRNQDGNSIEVFNRMIPPEHPQEVLKALDSRDGQRATASAPPPTQTTQTPTPSKHASLPPMPRKRAAGEEVRADGVDLPSSVCERKVVRLPKPRKRRGAATAPRPSPASLGIPSNLLDADQHVCGLATEAMTSLQNTTRPAEEWDDDRGDDDFPPSDDEEHELPLAQVVSTRIQPAGQDKARQTVSSGAPSLGQDSLPTHDGAKDEVPLPQAHSYGPKSATASLRLGPMSASPHNLRALRALRTSSAPPARATRGISLPKPVSRTGVTPAPSTAPKPLTIRIPRPVSGISATPVPTTVPNPVGTRVPKPLPPRSVPKLPLTVQPVIWAKSRQEVCESFDWFRSYQGGVYFNKEIAKGYLLGGFHASRDLFARDGRLIISHGGGKAESIHNTKGVAHLREASDQHEGDKSVRALLRTCLMKRPVALIIDDRYALFPYDLATKKDCTYAVLGFYHVAHAWAERQPADNGKGYVVRYKFAFEWCEKQPAPWWSSEVAGSAKATHDVATATHSHAQYLECRSCRMVSPLVYHEGWMCLQPKCVSFWMFSDGARPPEDLTYAESFLNAPMTCDHDMLEDIAPQPPATQAMDGVVTSRRFAKGWHCKQCGRLSCRYKWQHWECHSCGNILAISGKNRTPKEFWSQRNEKFLHHDVLDPQITVSPLQPFRSAGGIIGHYHIYFLPQNRGRVYLITGRGLMNVAADEIFHEYQEQAKTGELTFCRFPLRSHQCRGELLTNYFSQNSGAPYQYIGGTGNTVPFSEAPSAVLKARDLIDSRMTSVLEAESKNPYRFNEVLSAAYMEEQSMSFHSDAEAGLGPRVASLSLGSAAYMHFRLHKKYRTDGGTGNVRNSLTLFLRHGDVLIMDGADIQKYYEHTVVPLNFRIAATARYIGGRNH